MRRVMKGRLQTKMEEVLAILGEQINYLGQASNQLHNNLIYGLPDDPEILIKIHDIGIDILEFLDYADSFSSQSTMTRCLIQQYLEICSKKGYK